MSSLRRTRAGIFTEERALTLEYVMQNAADGRAEELLMPVDALFLDHEKTVVPDGSAEKSVLNGGGYGTGLPDGLYRVYGMAGDFLMLGSVLNGEMKTVKSFFEVK